MEATSEECNLKIVNVGGYMVPWNLARILKDVLAKYGGISGEKTLSPKLKTLVFFSM